MTVGAKKPSESIVRSVDELINPVGVNIGLSPSNTEMLIELSFLTFQLTCGNVLYMAYTELIQVNKLKKVGIHLLNYSLKIK